MSNLATLFSNVRESIALATARITEVVLTGHALEPVPVLVSSGARRTLWAKKIGLIAPVLALATLPQFASARSVADYGGRIEGWDTVAEGRIVDVQIHVDGVPAPLFVASGQSNRNYFQAFAGRNYTVVLHNRSARRVGVLLAVDGLNVVNGARTGLSSGEPMYVLDPWQQTEVRGWRTSLEQVRRFVFVDEKRSYAERTGQANRDMGWIRVLAFPEARQLAWFGDRPLVRDSRNPKFREEGKEQTQELDSNDELRGAEPESKGNADVRSRVDGAQPPTAQRGQAFENESRENGSFPGTGWGDRQYDSVRRVDFRAVSRPTDHLVFRYEYASGLRALGIFPNRDRLRERDGQMGFAKPPRW